MLFTGLGRSVLGETVPSVWVSPSAYGLGRFSRPRAQFLPWRTYQPVNNIYLSLMYFCIVLLYFWLMVKYNEWMNEWMKTLMVVVVVVWQVCWFGSVNFCAWRTVPSERQPQQESTAKCVRPERKWPVPRLWKWSSRSNQWGRGQ